MDFTSHYHQMEFGKNIFQSQTFEHFYTFDICMILDFGVILSSIYEKMIYINTFVSLFEVLATQ